MKEKILSQLNNHFGELVATYTFDAGPNACIFLTEKVCVFEKSLVINIIFLSIFQFVGLVAALLRHFFAGNDEPNFFRGEEVEVVEEDVAKLLGSLSLPKVEGGLKYLIHTSPGEGPEVLQVKLLV